MSVRRGEWVAPDEIRVGEWIVDPNCGQPGRVKQIEVTNGITTVSYHAGKAPPGRLGFVAKVELICRMVRAGR